MILRWIIPVYVNCPFCIFAHLAFRFCSLATTRSPLTTPTPLNITTTTIKARGRPPCVVEISYVDLDSVSFVWERGGEEETHIEMSWNTLARVVGVKEVACRAGEPSRTVARALWWKPHLRMMTNCEFMKVLLGLTVHTWIGQGGSGKDIWDKTYV